MSRIFANWRLKLLALVLTVGLLGAVAFSENPPEVQSVRVGVSYTHRPDGLVLDSYPTTIDVTVIGFADAINQYKASKAGATIDLAGARAGANQTFYARPQIPTPGVTPQSTSIPVVISIEPLKTVQLDIEVRHPNVVSGTEVKSAVATCGQANTACQVTVTGPKSLVDGLKAYVRYDTQISGAGAVLSPSQQILFERGGHAVDLAKFGSLPSPTWTPSVVTVRIDSVGSSQSKQVLLNLGITGSPPCGYTVTNVSVNPDQTVTVSGPADAVSKVGSATLDQPISLTGLTSSQTFPRAVVTGSAQVAADPPRVRVTLSVQHTFTCGTPVPSPTASPTP